MAPLNGFNKLFKKPGDVYVLDGGFGSLLESEGYDVNKHALWSGGANIESPDLVLKCYKAWIQSGANIITTNTYHCCIQKIREERNLTLEQAEKFITSAVDIAKRAISESGRHVCLVGSIGPYATYLRDGSEYSGAYVKKPGFDEQVIIDYYLTQCYPLLKSGIKFFAFETIPTLKEVECIGKVLSYLENYDVYAWLSVTCQDGTRTRSGDLFSDVVRLANSFDRIVAVGINCTAPSHVTQLLQNARTSKAIVVYPNSGEVYNKETRKFEGDPQIQLMTELIPTWYKLGARIFGGCCRVMPSHIQKIAEACNKLREELKVKE